MTSKTLLIFLMVIFFETINSIDQEVDFQRNNSGTEVLSRRKRFVIFPTGSSFSVAVCMTIGVYGNPQFSIFSWALNYGSVNYFIQACEDSNFIYSFAYNLPTNSSYFTRAPPMVLNFPFIQDEPSEKPEIVVTTTSTTESPHDFPPDHSAELTSSAEASSRRRYNIYTPIQFETKPMMQRRYRREIYKNFEGVMDK